MSSETLGDRMKRYENVNRAYLPWRTYTLMRLDGRAFHTYLRGAVKPFDRHFASDMARMSLRLCEEIQGAKFAYTQSDEVSLLLTDFDTISSQPWFGGNINKMVSLSAALATGYMTKLRLMWGEGIPQFDCRVWTMSDPVEVANYFIWRQRDAVRNSIQAAGQKYFSPAQLRGKNSGQIQEMLWSKCQINWNDYPPEFKRGQLIAPVEGEGWVTAPAPRFGAEPGTMLAQLIPQLPTLTMQEGDDSAAQADGSGPARS